MSKPDTTTQGPTGEYVRPNAVPLETDLPGRLVGGTEPVSIGQVEIVSTDTATPVVWLRFDAHASAEAETRKRIRRILERE
jgi:hypothetical protein